MLILALTTDKLQLVTTTAAATSVHASYVDDASGTFTAGKQNTAVASATTTDIVAVPGSSTQRNVKVLSIVNADASLSQMVTVLFNANGTTFTLFTCPLAIGEELICSEGTWQHFNVGRSRLCKCGSGKSCQCSSLLSNGRRYLDEADDIHSHNGYRKNVGSRRRWGRRRISGYRSDCKRRGWRWWWCLCERNLSSLRFAFDSFSERRCRWFCRCPGVAGAAGGNGGIGGNTTFGSPVVLEAFGGGGGAGGAISGAISGGGGGGGTGSAGG